MFSGRRTRWLFVSTLVALTAGACRQRERVIHLSVPANLRLAQLRFEPEGAIDRFEPTATGLDLWPSAKAQAVRVTHAEACPLDLPLGNEPTLTATLRPFLQVSDELAQVGFGQTANLVVVPGCAQAREGTLSWVETEGTLATLSTESRGFVLHARLNPIGATQRALPHTDFIAISHDRRDSHVLTGTWRGPGHANVTVTVRLHAAARHTGLPNAAVGQVVYLEGTQWHVRERPAGANERLQPVDGAATLFQADRTGRWVFERDAGDAETGHASIQVGTFGSTPLDCGRSGCHAETTRAFADNPMQGAFAHRQRDSAAAAPTCWWPCHTVGERGLRDEGFVDVSTAFAEDVRTRAYDELPVALQRATGVQCLNCHGIGRIPEPGARSAVLQVGVCAGCHDAPPRYGHVAAWLGSAMARADQSPATRVGTCKSCHTTAGFLGREVEPRQALGVTCVACHAPHSAHSKRLIRETTLPASLLAKAPLDATTRLCAQCHAPKADDAWPENSAVALVLGLGARRVADGAPLTGAAPHADLPGGCLACHRHGTGDGDERHGATHGFRASFDDCRTCHATDGRALKPSDAASAVLNTLARPSHVVRRAVDPSTPKGRKEWNLGLLGADRAAWAHNPAYTELMLRELQPSPAK